MESNLLKWKGEDIRSIILLVLHTDAVLTFKSIDTEVFHTIDFRCLHQLLQVLLRQVKKQLRIRKVRIKLRDLTDDLRITVVEGGLTLGIFIIDHNLLAIREEESGTLEEGQSTKEERQIIDCHLLRDAFTDVRGSDDILIDRHRFNKLTRLNKDRLVNSTEITQHLNGLLTQFNSLPCFLLHNYWG